MTVLVRTACRFLLLTLFQGAILSHLNYSSATVAASSRFHHVREMALHGSMARYRKLFQQDLELMSENLEERPQEIEAGGALEQQQHEGEFPDIEEADQEATIHNDGKEEVIEQFSEGNENTNPDFEESEKQHNGDSQTKGKERKKSNEQQKKGKKNSREKEIHSQTETEQHQGEEENKVDEGLNSEVPQEPKAQEGEPELQKSEEAEEEPNTEDQNQGVHQNVADEGQTQKSEAELDTVNEQRDLQEENTEQEKKTESVAEEELEVGNSQSESSSEESNSNEKPKDDHDQQDGDSDQALEQESKTEGQQQESEEELKGTEEKTTEDEKQEKEEEPFVFPDPYLIGPPIKDWDQQRGKWLDENPDMKTTPDGKPRVLIVTGSQPDPCRSSVGDHFHIQSLKLKIDYARMHNYEIYYNFAWLDPLFGSYWVKLPIVRKLMLTHPEIEWFFWVDSDAVFTDMLFEAPFDTYEGYNMVMWSWDYGFFTKKSWIAINAGVFLLRNCQWSLDLIDKWSPMGPDGPVREEYGKILTAFLSDREENYPSDDQSALAYLLLTDEEIKSKVKLIDLTEYMVSGWWVQVVDTYETSIEKYHPGLGDERWPWITHFTGCGPCGGDTADPDYEKCIHNINRAFNFADNQVLAYMGFEHESLSSPSIIRTRNETDRPSEFWGVNPWEERITELAAASAAA